MIGIVLAIIFGVVSIILLTITITTRHSMNVLNDSFARQTAKLETIVHINKDLSDSNSKLQQETANLKNELKNAGHNDGADDGLINAKKEEKERLITQVNELNNLSLEKTSKLKELEAQSENLLNEIKDLVATRDSSAADVKVIEGSINKLVDLLNQRATAYREALIASSQAAKKCNGELIELNDKEDRLIKLIDELKDNYADLAADFAAIEGKKIGLPKAKTICADKEKISGIYRLVLVDEPDICYIGQATDIKDRGYQHMKKLIGADVAGNEKLYNSGYIPSDFSWEVIEVGDGNGNRTEWMNKEEAYGINFYAAVEIGLNSKKGNLN